MSDLLLNIPENSLTAARIPRKRMKEELRKELALQLYREGLIPGAGASRLAGMAKAEFQYLLGERGIAQQLQPSDLEEELENLKSWEEE